MSEDRINEPRLHVHALDHEHGDVMLTANRSGLEQLRAQIDAALDHGMSMATGESSTRYLPSDGEWFDVTVVMRNREATWRNMPTPYYEERSW